MARLWAGVQGLSQLDCLSKSSMSWERDGANIVWKQRPPQREDILTLLIELIPENSSTILRVSWDKVFPKSTFCVTWLFELAFLPPSLFLVYLNYYKSPASRQTFWPWFYDTIFLGKKKKSLKKKKFKLLAQALRLSIIQPYLRPPAPQQAPNGLCTVTHMSLPFAHAPCSAWNLFPTSDYLSTVSAK